MFRDLTPRQEQLLSMLSEGKKQCDISEELNIKPTTTATTLSNARKRLNLETLYGAIAYWVLMKSLSAVDVAANVTEAKNNIRIMIENLFETED